MGSTEQESNSSLVQVASRALEELRIRLNDDLTSGCVLVGGKPDLSTLESEYVDDVERIQSIIAELETAIGSEEKASDGWRPIESAPRTRHSILVRCPDRQNTYIVNWGTQSDSLGRDRDQQGWFIFGGHGVALDQEPSHWMPLPPPPKVPHV